MVSNINQYVPTTPFIGRVEEIDHLQRELERPECRLISLVGAGGIGKTRLAVRVAASINNNYPDGVWFIDLQPLQSAEQLTSTIADVLGLSLTGQHQPEEALTEHLQHRQMLLVMDNFEHVIAGASMLARLIQNTPHIQILVTSREALNLPQEWLYPVKGLPVPASRQTRSGKKLI